jgi:hypothetical protein
MSDPRPAFRYRDLRPGDAYWSNWRDMSRREIVSGLTLLAWIPITFVLLLLLTLLDLQATDSHGNSVWFIPCALVALSPFIVSRVWAHFWPCPRCTQPFFGDWWFSCPFARNCVHCGLPRYAPADPHFNK